MSDYPLSIIVEQADQILAKNPTAELYQKFTCGNCGSRQTMDRPNSFYREGSCEECGHITSITHCGFIVVVTNGGENVSVE